MKAIQDVSCVRFKDKKEGDKHWIRMVKKNGWEKSGFWWRRKQNSEVSHSRSINTIREMLPIKIPGIPRICRRPQMTILESSNELRGIILKTSFVWGIQSPNGVTRLSYSKVRERTRGSYDGFVFRHLWQDLPLLDVFAVGSGLKGRGRFLGG